MYTSVGTPLSRLFWHPPATAVPGDAADTRVIWYTHPRAKSVFTDGLRVLAGYTESVIITFPQW